MTTLERCQSCLSGAFYCQLWTYFTLFSSVSKTHLRAWIFVPVFHGRLQTVVELWWELKSKVTFVFKILLKNLMIACPMLGIGCEYMNSISITCSMVNQFQATIWILLLQWLELLRSIRSSGYIYYGQHRFSILLSFT